ncbi:MAG: hypothetical protein ABIJ96_14260 [Elusimicrobiota bacterium]
MSETVPAAPEGKSSLPKLLIAGTALFVLLAAVSLAALLHFGRTQSEADSVKHLEDQAISVTQEELSRRE